MPNFLKRWESLLLIILVVVVVFNITQSPVFLRTENLINLFSLHIEKIIVALVMTLIIINGEIDLSVASVMGLAACLMATLYEQGTPMELAILVALGAGVLCGIFNGFWIAYIGLPSLAVTLAGLIGYRGIASMLVEDRSVTGFPEWFNALGQDALVGPLPLAMIVFFFLAVAVFIALHYSGYGRYIYFIGNNLEAARYSGVRVKRIKLSLFVVSSTIAAVAGILFAARLGAVRSSTAEGFELDIITMVLLGGVSIFGGKGTLGGVILSILIVLCLRNGMNLLSITGNTQSTVIGVLLILSVLIPNLTQVLQELSRRRQYVLQKE